MAFTPVIAGRDLPPVHINLLSDAQTKPTPAMREAMARAEVGDEQIGADPTINQLCERTAALLGKEAAVFLPSGTMCNVAGLLAHCRAGDEILAHETAHILSSEGGAHAALGGFQITPLTGPRGQFTADTLRAAFRVPSRYAPPQTLLCVEQTSNIGGGSVWSRELLADVSALAKERGLATHMDGARLLNACVASGVAARDMAAGWDSVWIDFTKGLGAPIGAVLAGSRSYIDLVWRWKQRLGGAFRQGGIAAAGCLYALDHHVERLAVDHANASALAKGLAAIDGIVVQTPETNQVYFETRGAGIDIDLMQSDLRARGVLVSQLGGRLRVCAHLDVTAAMIEEFLAITREIVRRR
jgi:threonine aldolase